MTGVSLESSRTQGPRTVVGDSNLHVYREEQKHSRWAAVTEAETAPVPFWVSVSYLPGNQAQ